MQMKRWRANSCSLEGYLLEELHSGGIHLPTPAQALRLCWGGASRDGSLHGGGAPEASPLLAPELGRQHAVAVIG